MNFNNEDEVLALFSRLLERLQQADGDHHNSSPFAFIYVAKGAQNVGSIQNQYVQPAPNPPQRKTADAVGKPTNPPFNADTPLSALFRENHHEELRKIIESWGPYLIDDNPCTDALALTSFEFDKKRIYSNRVYYDLLDLDAVGALQVSLSDLARYLADHSNLSNSYATLYRLLKKYRQDRI